jgi:hypothetical protein
LKHVILTATMVALTAAMLLVSSLSGSAQEGYSGQYAPTGQYDAAPSTGQYDAAPSTGQYATPATEQQQEGCGWYWGYTFSKKGGWEWWCWSPQLGWWYGESADGKSKIIAPKVNIGGSTGGSLQFFTY